MKKEKFTLFCCIITALSLSLAACSNRSDDYTGSYSEAPSENSEHSNAVDISEIDFTDRDFEDSYDESTASKINFSSEKVDIIGSGASVSGNAATVSKAGTYIVSGSCADGRILIDADDTAKIQLVFNGLTLSCKDGPALYIKSADKVFLTLADGTDNNLSDGGNYTSVNFDNADAVIFSKADLTLNGAGSLTVNGSYKHGIVSKDNLVITDGNISITAVNTAVCGKDCVKIGGGNIIINAGSDGIKSDNAENSQKGYVYITDGSINITSGNEGIQAVTLIKITDGSIDMKTGGGSSNASYKPGGKFNPAWNNADGGSAAKGLKCDGDIIIDGGSLTIDSSDDSIHSESTVKIDGGKLDISSGDDGIHADSAITVTDGDITIHKSYEGIESTKISIGSGKISIKAADDGINAAGGNDSSALGDRPGMGSFSSSDADITISGGYIFVDADGDGIDSNGSLNVTGGTVLVCGPTDNGNGAFDYDGSAVISGGTVIALGSSGMAQNFNSAQDQGSMLVSFTSQAAGTAIALCDEKGEVVLSLTATKAFNCALFTSPNVKVGSTYTVVAGADIDGADSNGFAESTVKTGGNVITTVDMTQSIVGSGGGMNHGGGPGGRPGGRW